ncbi:cellulose synthase/poly-beta-1,6-N-acetylglucosamine synthase-like glycosyltransferase [Aliiruegeria haliotis]|uniref:Cellulose synthase/poly-beta-1,6-N-acetylglucosamine synthase-like glycosyltransferase n=1 Tax=Aliiruegeria haliotis TaxID=1280846 RepID=A0A2T0RHN7_9RHOB|nr:glycosyltransferase [Aliiruegeria haliotis]PRY20642.1 cellulose synthase/poly-beta-1,6-N-acetylglucosamine synthase-like glycosyltransferase [Aliiruegeria haliotis]
MANLGKAQVVDLDAHPEFDASLANKTDFWSVDSQPRRLSGPVPVYRAPLLLVLFSVLAYGQLVLVSKLPMLAGAFPSGDYVLVPTSGYHSVSLRIFLLSFTFAFATFAQGTWRERSGIGARILVGLLLTWIAIDGAAWAVTSYFGTLPNLHVLEILSGLAGFAIFARVLLGHAAMPEQVQTEHKRRQASVGVALLTVVMFTAAIGTFLVARHDPMVVTWLRKHALLGGIGPGVFLFLSLFYGTLYLIGRVQLARKKVPSFAAPVTVIIPAHNEEYVIGRTIEAIDRAGSQYPDDLQIIVANNNSTDRTRQLAVAALVRCRFVRGSVIDVVEPGKSAALNAALAATATEFVIRIDADTQVDETAIRRSMAYFATSRVGVVGGMPDVSGNSFFDRARAVEVLVKHGFYSVALSAVGAVVGVPGMFSAYRTEVVRRLGGFVGGMNGEDTDMSLRIGEMGYTLIVDPEIGYVSEVPQSHRHMREQRMRWFRSIYHVSSRNRSIFRARSSLVRGKIVLPYMLLNSGRRAMMIPLFLFGGLSLLAGSFTVSIPTVQSVLAVALGAPFLMAVLSAGLAGRADTILGLPHYVAFRLLRAYFTLESHLSISLSGNAPSASVVQMDTGDKIEDPDLRTAA